MGKKIIVTESQMRRLLDKMINESKMGIDELDYQSYTEGDDLQQLRDAIDRNILVSVAFVKKDGSVRHMAIKKNISSYVGSDREKSEKQMNVEMNNNIKKVVDINAYNKKLKELRNMGIDDDQAKSEASKVAWRSISLENVLGFMVRGNFVDLRDENDIMNRFGEEVYNSLTKSMKNALAQDQMGNEQPEEI
jgi:hypothetical protein